MTPLPITRHSLLLRLADADDVLAWSEFLEVYERAVFRYACSRGLQDADAQDVTQRVLAAVADKVKSWQPAADHGTFRAWIFRVTRNLAAKSWNQNARSPIQWDADEDPKFDVAVEAAQATEFETAYRRALFHWAADRVREDVQAVTWKAFWMTTVEQQDAKFVAQQLNVSIASVYTAKCRMLARIRSEIERFEGEFLRRKDGD